MQIQKATRAAKKLYRKIFPKLNIIFFPTYFCNYHCPYCEYDVQEFPRRFPRGVEHGWEEWRDVFEQFEPATIGISGGETLSYKQMAPLVNALQERHTVGLTSNLSLPMTDFLESARKDVAITASFHPHTARLENFTQKVTELVARGFTSVSVNFVAYPDKIHLLPELKDFFDSRDIPFHVEAFTHPNHRYTPEEMAIVSKYTDGVNMGFDESRSAKRCLGGSKHLAITQNGDAFACAVGIFYGTSSPLYQRFGVDPAPFRLGNVFDGSFKRLNEARLCDAPCAAACDLNGAKVRVLKKDRGQTR